MGDRSHWKPQWPELEELEIPIGQGRVTREGTQATLVSYGRMLPLCNKVADTLALEGASVEVIDMRSIYPYDWGMIKRSTQKTGRVLFVNEDTEVTNFAEHLSYRVTNELFYELVASPKVLAGKNLPGIGLHAHLEEASVPHYKDILNETQKLLKEEP